MRFALLTYRFPWPVHTGDRLRATRWLDAMLPLGDVTLIAPSGDLPAAYRAVTHVPLATGATTMAGAMLRVAAGRLPVHVLSAGRFDWAGAIRTEKEAGPYDAAVVLLSRCDPWVGDLRAGHRVMDAIDASSLSMAMRARSARNGVAASLWRREARRAAVLEAEFARRYDCVMVASERERPLFGDRAIAVGSGVKIHPPASGSRDFDFGFWGRLEYFVNREAARTLLDVTWPAIRRELPSATLLIAGADAPPFVKAWHGRAGVTVISPMSDRESLVRRVRTALFPLRNGTGVSNKLLEAGEAGCAIVATHEALSGLDHLRDAALTVETDAALVAAAIELARAPERASAIGSELRRVVEVHYDAASAEKTLRDVLLRRGAA